MRDIAGRSLETRSVARWLIVNPNLPRGVAAQVAAKCETLADEILGLVADGPDLADGLRQLVRAKDCFVRAALDTTDGEPAPALPPLPIRAPAATASPPTGSGPGVLRQGSVPN